MRRHTNSRRSRNILRLITITAAVCATSSGCTQRGSPDGTLYTHGRIAVDKPTAERWDANENEVKAVGDRIQPIAAGTDSTTVPFGADGPAMLSALQPSERHGAGDKRMLSSVAANPRGGNTFQSSGIVAEVTLVKGSEYKSETAFKKGWLPLAVVVLPDTFPSGTMAYPKLKLRGGTSWIYAREDGARWVASLVRLVDGKIEQEPLVISTATDDKLEPVIGARFAWENTDESIWVYCGGKCCKMVGGQ
jgi:hypothetical protein